MTNQDLKTNRNEIIEAIKTDFPSANVKEFMTAMVRMLPLADSKCISDYVTEVGDLMFAEPFDNSASVWLAENNRKNAMANMPSSMR